MSIKQADRFEPEIEQLTIWTFLERLAVVDGNRVSADPLEANIIDLSNWIGSLDLESAGDALVTWGVSFRDRAIKLLDEWQHQPSSSLFAGELVEPQYDRAIFDELVLGRMEWDLGDLVETSDNYYPPERQAVSTVAPVSKSTALELCQQLQAAMDVAHSEDIDRWSRRIRETIAEYDGEISLSKLRERAGLSLVDVWLGLLLGDTECRVWRLSDEQLDITVDFYSLDGLLVTIH
jgi:hypothetical protein